MFKAVRIFVLLFCLIFSFISAASDSPILQSGERFHAVRAYHGMVATQERVATDVGVSILREGGNAVDAAVASLFALAVTLPRAGNIGGGGFMLLWLQHPKKAIVIDYREVAPLSISPQDFLNNKDELNIYKYTQSYLSSGVPGTVAGLVYAVKHYGHLSLVQDIAPAILLASKGFVVSQGLAIAIDQAQSRLYKDLATRKIFFKQGGVPYRQGDIMRRPDLANTLQLIAKHGDKGFYNGFVADQIVKASDAHGGKITHRDLSTYRVVVRKPIIGHYHGFDIIGAPPPSSGGIIINEMLNILKGFDISKLGFNNADYLHVISEVMNLGFLDRNEFLGDPSFMDIPENRLLSSQHANTLRHSIDVAKHVPAHVRAKQQAARLESRQTTHVSVADKDGNLVSNTYSLNFSFGNAKTIPGTGILLNNTMADFTAHVAIANPFGLLQGEANCIEPGKRPLSSMSPTLLIDHQNNQFIATGSPGGSHILTSVLQQIINMVDFNQGLGTAIVSPRIHSQLWPDKVQVEQGFNSDTLDALRHKGHAVSEVSAMGSLQTVEIRRGVYYGYADPRRIGAKAAGY